MNILALDLASVTGWAVGEIGKTPDHGSIRFASVGASHEAVFASAAKWIDDKITAHAPGLIVWESPMPTSFSRGNSNINTTMLLYGLPAVIGAVAYMRGVYDCRRADTKDVRNHFIGCNPKRAKAKPMVIRQCLAMGWNAVDDNAADALSIWHFMCSLIDPRLAIRPTPLFGRCR